MPRILGCTLERLEDRANRLDALVCLKHGQVSLLLYDLGMIFNRKTRRDEDGGYIYYVSYSAPVI